MFSVARTHGRTVPCNAANVCCSLRFAHGLCARFECLLAWRGTAQSHTTCVVLTREKTELLTWFIFACEEFFIACHRAAVGEAQPRRAGTGSQGAHSRTVPVWGKHETLRQQNHVLHLTTHDRRHTGIFHATTSKPCYLRHP